MNINVNIYLKYTAISKVYIWKDVSILNSTYYYLFFHFNIVIILYEQVLSHVI